MRPPLTARLLAASLLSLAALLPVASAGDKGGDKKEPAAGKRKVLYRLNPSMQFDLFLVDVAGKRHKLTYASEEGNSNNLVFVSIDGKTFVFGVDAKAKLPRGLHGGKWETKKAALGKGPDGNERLGHKSVWLAGEVRVTQTLEIVPSRDGSLDACLITYDVENFDDLPYKVGLRVVVDVYAGANDAPAFALPNSDKLITTSADLRGKDIPYSVQALEKPDLKDPGVAGYFTLRPGAGVEGPGRFTVTHFPTKENIKDLLAWEIPVRNMKAGPDDPGDAAVVMYWDARAVNGGGQRRMGFAYGGGVAANALKKKQPEQKEKTR
jgi:hypothetical protein